MGTGPAAGPGGADLTLTELASNGGHHFLVNAGSEAGSVLLERIEHRDAREDEVGTARELVESAGRMGRAMPEVDLRALLAAPTRQRPRPGAGGLASGAPAAVAVGLKTNRTLHS
jgi:hypothetical protein